MSNGIGQRTSGGYLLKQTPIYTTRGRHKLEASQEAKTALNVIQQTAWTINSKTHDFAEWLAQSEHRALLGLKPQDTAPKTRLSKLEYAGLTAEEKSKLRLAKRGELSNRSKDNSASNTLSTAAELVGKGSFYHPHRMCFRGRIYPHSVVFSAQANHVSKGLMMFAKGAALGADGLEMLAHHVANTWGQDKLQLEERKEYVESRIEVLREVSNNYEAAAAICAESDEPLAFYAAACDYVAAVDSGDPENYVSHIPCAVDGTCNGLQILSLLGHDAVGAHKTNCTSEPQRQDVYLEVADIAYAIVTKELESEELIKTVDVDGKTITVAVSTLAQIWHEHLQDSSARRKAVKRSVMTTAYGCTSYSIANNLKTDGIVAKLAVGSRLDQVNPNKVEGVLAEFFKNVILKAREGALQTALQIMSYISEVAQRLAKEGQALTWTTPDGTVITQRYTKIKQTFYESETLGRMTVSKITDTPDPSKCSSSAAPNLVHSLDAAMLRVVVKRMAELGHEDFAMIHDSYGVPAGHITTLNRVIREVAVEMFSGDWLRDEFAANLPKDIELPEPPKQGDLDVSAELPNAAYFFS